MMTENETAAAAVNPSGEIAAQNDAPAAAKDSSAASAATARAPHSLQGKVVKISGDKTITVLIERKIKHPLYQKYVRRSTKVHAHDEDNQCRPGDTVVVQSCRPLSKLKCWRLLEVVGKVA